METLSKKKMVSILQILQTAEKPIGGARIAHKLLDAGYDMSQRTARYYLKKMDKEGLTENLGKRGRRITATGEQELKNAFVYEKVGFVASKIDALTYEMSFSARTLKGKIILNMSVLNQRDLPKAMNLIQSVFRAGLGMGRYIVVGRAGNRLGTITVPDGKVAVGTLCSVTINGVLLKEGIHTTSRFGGLLEMYKGRPLRFTEIIYYEGSSLDPLEIFIKGGMTSVREAALTGNGRIGASFREVPAVALQKVEKIRKKLDRNGLGGILMIGKPGHPLLGIPVPDGRVGMIVAGGLNPLAAVEESGISTENVAMKSLFEFSELIPFWELGKTD